MHLALILLNICKSFAVSDDMILARFFYETYNSLKWKIKGYRQRKLLLNNFLKGQ